MDKLPDDLVVDLSTINNILSFCDLEKLADEIAKNYPDKENQK